MANEITAPHGIRLDEREHLTVTGVREVESFDETIVALQTVRGLLIIHGAELHLCSLSADGGQIDLRGSIDSLSYESEQRRGGFFRRLFG